MSTTILEPKSRKGIGGPKTAEGKKRVSLNAMKHGLDAKSPQAKVTIEDLVGVSYEEMLAEMREHYQPADAIEEILIQRVARCAWRITYLQAIEDKYLQRRTHLSIGNGYQKILKNERLIDIQLHRAIAALARKQEAREKKSRQADSMAQSAAPTPTENCKPSTDNIESQNKLNEAPTPSSTHAQSEGEFVPHSNANKPIPSLTVNRQLPTANQTYGTCGSWGRPGRPRVRLGIRYPLFI